MPHRTVLIADPGRDPSRLGPWPAHAFATAVTVATLWFRVAIDGLLGGEPTLVIFTLPIMLSAYAGGLGSGLLATALTYFGASYYLLPPLHGLEVASGVERLQLFFVVLAGVVISALNEALHRARRRADRITRESRETERARFESESRYQTLFDRAPDGILIADSLSNYIDANPSICRMLGYTREELIGLNASDIVAPQEIPQIEEALRAIHAEADSHREWQFRRKDGTAFVAEVIAAMMPDGSLFGLVRDITDRKRAEATMRESEELFSAAFESSPVALAISTEEGTYVQTNAAFCALVGYTREEIVGRRLMESGIATAEERAALIGALDRAGGSMNHIELKVRIRDGSFRDMDCSIAPITLRGVRHRLSAQLDITERREARDELLQAHRTLELRVVERTAQLEAANRELEALSTAISRDLRVAEAADKIKSAFLATMSHELRTPLNSILGFTGIVLQGMAGPLNAEQTKQLGMVQGSARHLLELINDVLDLSKIEAGQLEVLARPFDLRASLVQATAGVRPLADRKGLVLTVEVSPALEEMVSDRRRVEQILINLLGNAIKFTDAGGVTLSAEPAAALSASAGGAPEPAVRLRVTDTGMGMKKEDLTMLFQPFHQIDSGTARGSEGTGLGLAICRRLATLLGGEITAASEWSKGSEFTVTLPLRMPALS